MIVKQHGGHGTWNFKRAVWFTTVKISFWWHAWHCILCSTWNQKRWQPVTWKQTFHIFHTEFSHFSKQMLSMEHTYLYFIAFIYIFIIACGWRKPHIMEWYLSLGLPATNKNTVNGLNIFTFFVKRNQKHFQSINFIFLNFGELLCIYVLKVIWSNVHIL